MHQINFSKIYIILGLSYVLILAGCGMGDKNNREGKKETRPALLNYVEYLDDMLQENSGLIHFRGTLWTINDSGGDPVLFALDKETGKTLQAIYVKNGSNKDWESLAQDKQNIYICDVGNNYGRRDELEIYIISKDSIPSSGNATVTAEIIHYTYADRIENNGPFRRSPFDCEAAFAFGDSLYLFTKDWETLSTTLYTCPTSPGTYSLKPRQTFPVDGLITGADISPDCSHIILCGYKDHVPLIWIFSNFNPMEHSTDTIHRFDYPGYIDLQTEGIAIVSPEEVLISCELTEYPAALYILNLLSYLK
ncbi:hypothetical protein ACFLTU_04940 [Bacteroidota bacterium]